MAHRYKIGNTTYVSARFPIGTWIYDRRDPRHAGRIERTVWLLHSGDYHVIYKNGWHGVIPSKHAEYFNA